MPARQRTASTEKTDAPQSERLQKVLAASGVASRRAAEELILEGRVTVNGRVILELGTKVDPSSDDIRVAGKPLKQPRLTYMILNKPRGYITTVSDPEGRRTVYDLLEPGATRERIYPVGRLDMDSEGLLLLTNDGELTNRIAHPRYRLDKEYNALVEGNPSPGALARLAHGGFLINGGRTSPAQVTTMGHESGGTWLRVIIHEGRKRQVRRMLEEIGHPVRRLRRVRLGPLTLAGLPAATHRPLTPEELQRLRRMVGLGGETARSEQDANPETRREPGGRTPTRALGEGRPRSTFGRPSGGELPARPQRTPTARRDQAKGEHARTGRPVGGPPHTTRPRGGTDAIPRDGGRDDIPRSDHGNDRPARSRGGPETNRRAEERGGAPRSEHQERGPERQGNPRGEPETNRRTTERPGTPRVERRSGGKQRNDRGRDNTGTTRRESGRNEAPRTSPRGKGKGTGERGGQGSGGQRPRRTRP